MRAQLRSTIIVLVDLVVHVRGHSVEADICSRGGIVNNLEYHALS